MRLRYQDTYFLNINKRIFILLASRMLLYAVLFLSVCLLIYISTFLFTGKSFQQMSLELPKVKDLTPVRNYLAPIPDHCVWKSKYSHLKYSTAPAESIEHWHQGSFLISLSYVYFLYVAYPQSFTEANRRVYLLD